MNWIMNSILKCRHVSWDQLFGRVADGLGDCRPPDEFESVFVHEPCTRMELLIVGVGNAVCVCSFILKAS